MRCAFLLTIALGLLSAPPVGWDHYQIFPSSLDENQPRMTYYTDGSPVNPQSRFLLSFIAGSELYIRSGYNLGYHWFNPVKISNAATHNAEVIATSYDVVTKPTWDSRKLAVWTEYNQSQDEYSLWFSYSTDPGGLIWSSPQRIDNLIGAAGAVEPHYPDLEFWLDAVRLSFYYSHPGGKEIGYSKFDFWNYEWYPYETVATRDDLLPGSQITSERLGLPHRPHIIYAYGDGSECVLMHAVQTQEGWQKNWVYTSNNGIIELSEFLSTFYDQPNNYNYLHIAFQQLRLAPDYAKTGYCYSTDLGQTWSVPDFFGPPDAPSRHSDISERYDTLHLVYTWGSNAIAYRCREWIQGDWNDRILIVEDLPCLHPTVACDEGPHVAFQTTTDQNQTGYLANLWRVVMSTSEATAPNWSRHLTRTPGTDILNVVFQSDFRPDQSGQHDRNWIYFTSASADTGILKSEPQWLSYGRYPALDMLWLFSPAGPMHTVAYLSEDGKQIRYRWFDPENQVWSDPIVVYANPSGHDLDAPAITAVDDTVFILFAENSETESWIKCAWFKFDEITPILFYTVRW
ncbi:MAG TPA: hypothetical protein EYP24_03285, partial [bacterium (Candidatus Stahlbacteria)]|nr:hypothetical protein [Candidatus Stahlbacteria bacterium]